ncbi:MAG: DNA polymerase III subunit epsilon, partial [Pseudomonadota bacterium]
GNGWRPAPRPQPLKPRLTKEESVAHEAFVAKLGDAAVWKKLA